MECGFYRWGFMKEKRLLIGVYMCGICFILPVQGKNNKHCLET